MLVFTNIHDLALRRGPRLQGERPMRFEDIVIQQFAEFERRLIALERRMNQVAPEQLERSPIQTPPEPIIQATDAPDVESAPAPIPPPTVATTNPLETLLQRRSAAIEFGSALRPNPSRQATQGVPAITTPSVYSLDPVFEKASAEAHESIANQEPELPRPQSLESIVGGRWFAVAGAIAVLVAIVLFLKLAYSQGWLGRIPPSLRCIFGAGFGIALLASGELARRKINAWAAVGLLAAGVAGLYASVLAAYSLYHLFNDATAFALLAVVSAIGIATGARSRLPVVSIVSVIGAYMAPFLLESPNPSPFVFPIYMLAILATGLTLSAWLRGGFRAVGAIVWWGTLALGGLWISDVGDTHPVIALCFAALAWACVHTSHVVSTRTPQEPPSEHERHMGWQVAIPAHQLWMLASSFSYSTWATMLAVWIAKSTGIVPDWAPSFTLAGVTAIFAFALIPSLRLLREVPTTGRERLGTALLAQSGGLVIAGTALAAFGIAAVPTWLALGIAAILAGRIIHSRALDAYGLVAMCIGTVRLFAYDCWQGTLNTPNDYVLGIAISDALWWAICTGGGWIVASLLLLWRLPLHSMHRPRPLAGFAMGIAFLTLMGAPLVSHSEATSVTIAWAALACVGILLGNLGRRVVLTELALSVLVTTSAKTLLLDSLAMLDAPADGTSIAGLVLSTWTAACLALCVSCILTVVLVPARFASLSAVQSTGLWIGRIAAGFGILFAMIAALHPESIGTSVAIAWMLLGFVVLMLAPLRPGLWLEGLGTVVLASMLGRLLVIDGLTGLPTDGVAWHGLFLTRWCLAMSLGGGVWMLTSIVLSFRTGASRVHAHMPGVATAAGIFMLGTSIVHPQAELTSILWAWLGLTAVTLAASPLRPSMRLNWSGAGACIPCLTLWFIEFVVSNFDWSGSAQPLFLHQGLWSAFALAALIGFVAPRRLNDVGPDCLVRLRSVAVCLAGVLVWTATSLEAARVGTALTGDRTVQLAFVSIWWAVFAVGLIVVGFKTDTTAARRTGLALMAVAMAKVVIYDMGGVPQVWRIASFLLLGLIMIGIAAGYSRAASLLLPKQPAS